MAPSMAILLSISFVLAGILSVLGGLLGLAILGWTHRGLGALAGLPRVSTVTPVPATLVAASAILGIAAVLAGGVVLAFAVTVA